MPRLLPRLSNSAYMAVGLLAVFLMKNCEHKPAHVVEYPSAPTQG